MTATLIGFIVWLSASLFSTLVSGLSFFCSGKKEYLIGTGICALSLFSSFTFVLLSLC